MWRTTNKPLPRGWYWWRSDDADLLPEMFYSNGQTNVQLQVGETDYYTVEDDDWSGEWAGPINAPAS